MRHWQIMTTPLETRFDKFKASGLLPSPKGAAMAVVALTRKDDVSTEQLARAIQADPALVARLIKLANRTIASGARPVLAIKDAIRVLGLNAVRGLALGFSLMSSSHSGRCAAFNYPAFWSRNLARAVAMQDLSALLGVLPGDEAFSLGLLSQVGELGLASLFPQDYAQLLSLATPAGNGLLAQEVQAFAMAHLDLTAAMLADWGFPASLIAPIGLHGRQQKVGSAAGLRARCLLQQFTLACAIADVCQAAPQDRHAQMADLLALGAQLPLGRDDLLVLCDSVVRKWTDWCLLLEVPAQALPPFAQLLEPPLAVLPVPAVADPIAPAQPVFRLLLVHGKALVRASLKTLLTAAGYSYTQATSSQQAMQLASTEPPELMLVDGAMPQMDGIALIRALRQTDSGRAIYVLLLTSDEQEQHLADAFAAGADDFLSQSSPPHLLLGRLLAAQRVLSLRRDAGRDQTQLQNFATEFARLNQRLHDSDQASRASQQRMELALHCGGLGMWDLHIPSGAVVFSERDCAMLGYRLDEIKPDAQSWHHLAHPDDWPAIHAALQAHLKRETPFYECEHRIRHKDGHWVWILDRGRVVEWDAAGAPVRVVGTHMDINARKQTQAALLEQAQELARSNRELEQFSYSISHDMRQPLRMISSYLQLLHKSLGDTLDAEQRSYFNFAIDGAQRLDAMLLGLLDYSRVGHHGEPPVWIESRSVLDEALLFLRPLIAEAQAQVHIEGDWPRILASPDELLRLLQNLVGNALKFRVAGRLPQISVTSSVTSSVTGSGAAGGAWQVCIADNGVGMLPDQIGRLFQVFARLQSRAAYEGTGIGLALCRKIAEHHGGRIWAESGGEGLGSRFCLLLPLAQQEAAP
jgi:PAS domain S-box-containing protein